ncbi:hypothetical protein [Cohnella terricola]|uniref:Uncharacterized protein n=1 Tax=Cohnella terricola TaxID=1289167 RepID=A0A559JQB1_9BACL|nr:hypothetical protein [Cohnella terricola]TVY02050.1 hypothetical protein FPZ45_06305 [Cohnella terricola]
MNLGQQKACVIFNKLAVNNIENSSGIFIGTNMALGWTSYSKENQGLGRFSNTTLTNALGVVHDPDLIDMPIEEVRNITLMETSNSLQQNAIDFNAIYANSIQNTSALDLGDNKQLGWRTARKVNEGFGRILGRNLLKQVANTIADNDFVDAHFSNQGIINENIQTAEKNISINQNKPNTDDTTDQS